jgi:hypothetical protein
MSTPRTAPYGSVRLADVETLEQVDPSNVDVSECDFHLLMVGGPVGVPYTVSRWEMALP